MAFFTFFFQFQTLITWKLCILGKNYKSTILFIMTQKAWNNFFEVKKSKICSLFKQFFLNNGGIIFCHGPNCGKKPEKSYFVSTRANEFNPTYVHGLFQICLRKKMMLFGSSIILNTTLHQRSRMAQNV